MLITRRSLLQLLGIAIALGSLLVPVLSVVRQGDSQTEAP